MSGREGEGELNPQGANPQQPQQTEVVRRRLGRAPVVLELLPGDRHAGRGHPRLRLEPAAVRDRSPGREGDPADRHELLHVEATPDGASG